MATVSVLKGRPERPGLLIEQKADNLPVMPAATLRPSAAQDPTTMPAGHVFARLITTALTTAWAPLSAEPRKPVHRRGPRAKRAPPVAHTITGVGRRSPGAPRIDIQPAGGTRTSGRHSWLLPT